MTCSRYPHLLRAMHSTNNCHQNCLIFSSLMLMLMKNGKYASRKESLSSGWYQLVFMIVQNTIFFEETQHSPKKEKYIKKSIITRLFWPLNKIWNWKTNSHSRSLFTIPYHSLDHDCVVFIIVYKMHPQLNSSPAIKLFIICSKIPASIK
jgi:hypothetical protein